jgi:hypothetical protein
VLNLWVIESPIQSIADELEGRQLLRKRRIQWLQFIPLAGHRPGIVEVIHNLDDVGVVSAMEVEMVPRFQLRGRPLVVVIEGEWRTIEILTLQSPVNPFLMA